MAENLTENEANVPLEDLQRGSMAVLDDGTYAQKVVVVEGSPGGGGLPASTLEWTGDPLSAQFTALEGYELVQVSGVSDGDGRISIPLTDDGSFGGNNLFDDARPVGFAASDNCTVALFVFQEEGIWLVDATVKDDTGTPVEGSEVLFTILAKRV